MGMNPMEKTAKTEQHSAKSTSKESMGGEQTANLQSKRAEHTKNDYFSELANSGSVAVQLKALENMANPSFREDEVENTSQTSNHTGLPDNLKNGVEQLSGLSMDDVKVNYNSSKPAQLSAHAYAQGSDIHVASGQQQHLPHEAWHVVQQKMGRVQPTSQLDGAVPVNDDAHLEEEADIMGAKALQAGQSNQDPLQAKQIHEDNQSKTIQYKKTLALDGEVEGVGTSIKNFFTKGTTFTQLKEAVNKFNNAATDEEQKGLTNEINALCLTWLEKHKAEGEKDDPEKKEKGGTKKENDEKKRVSIIKILRDLETGEITKGAVEDGIFNTKEDAQNLGFFEENVKNRTKKDTEDFIVGDEIKDQKGMIKDTSFMAKMVDTMKEKVLTAESDHATLESNEKTMRTDAGVHTFFHDEILGANNPDQRRAVTQHAKNTYSSSFYSKIIKEGLFPSKKGDGDFDNEDEVSHEKLVKFKEGSFKNAEEIHSLNGEAETDVATMYVLAEQVQKSQEEEAESFKIPLTAGLGDHEKRAQGKRNMVLDLVKDANVYAEKVNLQKKKSDDLIKPLEEDGRIAGWYEKGKDKIKTAAMSQITQLVTMGLVSASSKYKVGGISSSQSFDLKEDKEGNLTAEVEVLGSADDSKYDFKGPRGVISDVFSSIQKAKSNASKFQNKQPITGFYIFSGVLQQLETGLAYIKQIAGTIQMWASGLSLIPGAAPITLAISAVCEAIKKAITTISNTSKAARMIFTSLVKVMNHDPKLWGLVEKNFNAGIVENMANLAGQGAEIGFAAGMGEALHHDAAKGAKDSLTDEFNWDSVSIKKEKIADMAVEHTKNEKLASAGAEAIAFGSNKASNALSSDVVGSSSETDNKATARTTKSIEAFKTAAQGAVPKSAPILQGMENVLTNSAESQTKAEEVIPEVQKAKTEKSQQSADSGTTTPEDLEFNKKADDSISDAKEISETTGVVKDIAEEVVKAGNVATLKAMWQKRINDAEQERERMKGQKGSGVK
ncbi:MAG: hypothetical protein RI965_2041 [Bacteroidota bacterium]|jgi:hypothetical protein